MSWTTIIKQSSDLGRKSEWIDRRASHLAEIDITEELEDGQIGDARIVIARAVENVIQHFNHLKNTQNYVSETTQKIW